LSASEAKRKGEGVRWAGGEAEMGHLGPACARGKKRPTTWEFAGCEEEEGKGVGSAGGKGREEREKEISLFFKLFSNLVFFKLSNFNQTRNHAFES
jgi:hypothetical protein